MTKPLIAVVLMSTFLSACDTLDDPSLNPVFDASQAEAPPSKPLASFNKQRQVFWGDLHIHTGLSYDAYTTGVRTLPDDAYRFMKGGTIEHGMGYPIKMSRPLDFGAVTDHSEYLGVPRHLDQSKGVNQLRAVMETGSPLKITWNYLSTIVMKMSSVEKREEAFGLPGLESVSLEAWQHIIDTAERHNDPGRFTAFIGYEWTSMPNGDNLHRNVIYKTSLVPEFPFSSRDSDNPEDLWDALDKQREQGMSMISIPHNGNVSNGLMYSNVMFDGGALSADYAEQRLFNEPISEILQVKGGSETHPILSSNDEFADFEIYDQRLSADGDVSQPKGSYARDALRTGLELSHSEGFNPYQFGVIGSSDSHNSSSSVEENNFHGKLPMMDGTAGLRAGKALLMSERINRAKRWSAMGLAGVWAEENTRDSLFEAMRRKETYATSGPRISLRFFAGWQYPDNLLEQDDLVEQAYQHGVPMGAELQASAKDQGSPVFAVWAVKDPQGANLDRIQIIKGWVDSEGLSHEQVYNVAASDGRVINPIVGQLEPVGNTVDAATATYSNSIGDGQLAVLWQDPSFDASQQAFYYARVLEIPTPRYSTFDAKTLGIQPSDPVSIQERAISSAIWYSAK